MNYPVVVFRKAVGNIQVNSNLIRIMGTLPESLCTLMMISRLSFLSIRHVSQKGYREKYSMLNIFFLLSKIVSFMRECGKI